MRPDEKVLRIGLLEASRTIAETGNPNSAWVRILGLAVHCGRVKDVARFNFKEQLQAGEGNAAVTPDSVARPA